jgi:hypothetical protein
MRLTKYLISLFAAPLLPAQVVVIDPSQIANNQANHIVDLAKYVEKSACLSRGGFEGAGPGAFSTASTWKPNL